MVMKLLKTFFSFLLLTVLFAYFVFFSDNINLKYSDLNKGIIIHSATENKNLTLLLYSNNVIKHRLTFNLVAKLALLKRNIIPGFYRFKAGMNNLDIIKIITAGLQTPLNVVFDSNVITKEELVQKITNKLSIDDNDLLSLLNDNQFLSEYGFNSSNVMCMFIPNTYEIYWNVNVKTLFKRFYSEYCFFWNNVRLDKAKKLKLTPIQVYILASIVNAETVDIREMQTIAGVYINRLNNGRLLQSCPTVKYANKDFSSRRILIKDLLIDSPYNTYKYKGLPIGPIKVASIASIDAVLNYEKHDYLYFSAVDDLSGKHYFSKTFEEHKNKAKLYRSRLNKEAIYR